MRCYCIATRFSVSALWPAIMTDLCVDNYFVHSVLGDSWNLFFHVERFMKHFSCLEMYERFFTFWELLRMWTFIKLFQFWNLWEIMKSVLGLHIHETFSSTDGPAVTVFFVCLSVCGGHVWVTYSLRSSRQSRGDILLTRTFVQWFFFCLCIDLWSFHCLKQNSRQQKIKNLCLPSWSQSKGTVFRAIDSEQCACGVRAIVPEKQRTREWTLPR